MYTEPLTQFIPATAQLYVPKNGGLKDYCEKLLEELQVPDTMQIKKIRGEDIPQRIYELFSIGTIAYGLTGDDLYDEWRLVNPNAATTLALYNTYDWFDDKMKFKRPTLCLLTKKQTETLPSICKIGVSNKYVSQATQFVNRKSKQIGIESALITGYGGDVESTVTLGINDCCIDIVDTGNSFETAGLRIIDYVRFSDISLIGPTPQKQTSQTNVWEEEYRRICARVKTPTESYTSRLLQNQNELVKKFGSESAEFVQAIGDDKNLDGEGLDVLYSVMIAWAKRGFTWDELCAKLKERQN